MDRNTFLRDKLSNFLQRLNPPKAMQSNAEAQKEEITDLYKNLIWEKKYFLYLLKM